jgi:hypothetical protein
MLITPFFSFFEGKLLHFQLPSAIQWVFFTMQAFSLLLAEGDTTILWLALALALVLQDADLQPWISNLKFAASKTLVNEKLIN